VADGLDLEELDDLFDEFAVPHLFALGPGEVRERLHHRRAHVDMTPDHDVLDDRHAREDVRALECAGDAGARDLVHRAPGDVFAVQLDAPALRPVEAAQAVHQGGLAGAVGADHRKQLVVAHLDRDVVQRHDTAKGHPDIAGGQHDRVGGPLPGGHAASGG
jgi:hypothetical protein